MLDLLNRVDTPHRNDHPNISPWIDEHIWGHRLWDNQSPWLLFLEFLTVAEACHRENRLLNESEKGYPLIFKPYKRMYLRNLLFNNEMLFQIAERYSDSSTAWAMWLTWMRDKSQGVTERDFTYLKTRFHTFDEFAQMIRMLMGAVVESHTNKRWTSRFIFPFGPAALYEDLGLSASGNPTREYINFGRTGELLYMMLCRCALREALKPHLSRLFTEDNSWNHLLARLQPGPDTDTSNRGQSYLPYRIHPAYDRLGADWLSIFELNLPGFDTLPHLVTLSALHVLLYQLETASAWTGGPPQTFMICEVVAPKKTLVRALSANNYLANHALPAQAIDAYLDSIEQTGEWQRAVSASDPLLACREQLEAHVRWGQKFGGATYTEMRSDLREEAVRGHRQHGANIHRNYGRDIGLVSRRGTTRLRYAPTDSLLKTLLLANVEKRMELSEFLDQLFERYGLVFGEREAEQVLSKEDFDKKSFQANARRLEQRLSSLGMLRRLSDSCAYVENPYGQGHA
jgi:hypothetical protein